MNGVLNIDKPAGMTSHDVVARVRRLSKIKRVGHAGTLDPDATGVLLVCIGPATRIADLLADGGKRYRCTLVLGAETDSEDATGTVTSETDASQVTEEQLQAAIPRFVGEIMQVPPMVSAVHHEGRRLYELARKGITVDRRARPVTIESLSMADFIPGRRATATLDVQCGKGTYIRTLCADIGRTLIVGGHMGTLQRTAVGSFELATSVPLDHLTPETIASRLVRAGEALSHLDVQTVDDPRLIDDLRHGRGIPGDFTNHDHHTNHGSRQGQIVLVDHSGDLIALARLDDQILRPYKVFPDIP